MFLLVSNVNYEREEAKRHHRSHDAMLNDCVVGFGQVLYLALKAYYFVSRNEDDREEALDGNAQLTYEISYPGLAPTTIFKLSRSISDCINFLWRLLKASGASEGSPYFFLYNYKKDMHDPLKAAKNMEWKLLLPWCLVVPLIRTFFVNRKLRTHQRMNRACMYFLDLPI